MNTKSVIPVMITAALTSVAAVWGMNKYNNHASDISFLNQEQPKNQFHFANTSDQGNGGPVDFTAAAELSVKSVVHINTVKKGQTYIAQDPFGFYNDRTFKTPDAQGAGSGVIISSDGYIITNNHVIAGADQVKVTFNDRNTQIAKVIGTDPSTDLALLKIEGNNFPAITFGDSEGVKLGQWVLAVGYPLNLDATVTAGIVSAKGRSIGINKRNAANSAIESFIQTDAAVNPGNSGGALVNTQGALIGINAAIASPTGSYAGYSYAIPSNLARKVAADLMKYGSVQRGYLGAELLDINKISQEDAQKIGISEQQYKNSNGVYVSNVLPGSAAANAGINKGDFITSINDITTNTAAVLMEQIALNNPGSAVKVTYDRKGKSYKSDVVLKSLQEGNKLANSSLNSTQFLGAKVRELSSLEKQQVEGGVVIEDVGSGNIKKYTRIQNGFVITSINDEVITNIKDLQTALSKSKNSIRFGGTMPNTNATYFYGLPLE